MLPILVQHLPRDRVSRISEEGELIMIKGWKQKTLAKETEVEKWMSGKGTRFAVYLIHQTSRASQVWSTT